MSKQEIRFRVWDGERMHVPKERYGPGEPWSIYPNGEGTHHLGTWYAMEPVYMLSTGLHDDEGREVFRGDVLRVMLDNYEVRSVRGALCLHGPGHLKGFNVGSFHADDISIIGNIYENPDDASSQRGAA